MRNTEKQRMTVIAVTPASGVAADTKNDTKRCSEFVHRKLKRTHACVYYRVYIFAKCKCNVPIVYMEIEYFISLYPGPTRFTATHIKYYIYNKTFLMFFILSSFQSMQFHIYVYSWSNSLLFFFFP